MKKIIYLIIALTGSGLSAYAQTVIPRVGLTVSSNSIPFTDDEIELEADTKSLVGFTFGVGFNLPLITAGDNVFSLQPELAYVQKGFKAKASFSEVDGEEFYNITITPKFIINYLEMPVLAKFEFGSPTARFFVAAGPSLGYGLGGKAKIKYSFDSSQGSFSGTETSKIKFGDEPEDNEDNVYFDNRLDVGAQFGIGATLLEKVTIDVRYGLGFTDLIDDESSKNHVFQFSVGVPIALK